MTASYSHKHFLSRHNVLTKLITSIGTFTENDWKMSDVRPVAFSSSDLSSQELMGNLFCILRIHPISISPLPCMLVGPFSSTHCTSLNWLPSPTSVLPRPRRPRPFYQVWKGALTMPHWQKYWMMFEHTLATSTDACIRSYYFIIYTRTHAHMTDACTLFHSDCNEN